MTVSYNNKMDNEAEFRACQQKPLIAVPTVLLAFVCVGTYYTNIYLGITGGISLWAGCVMNCIAGYFLFSPIHDGLHRSISSNQSFNDFIAFLTVNGLTPYASVKLFRFMHMQHHRYTNEPENDPDHFAGKGGWRILTLWFFWDVLYLIEYWKLRDTRPEKELRSVYLGLLLGLPLTGLMFYLFPVEIFWLWFVPNRMTVWLICYIFMYLPHRPHTIEQKDAPYQATLIRKGWDWLLDPLLVYQNYHLVHHLYPTIPFYRYKKAWFARRKFHTDYLPAEVSAFQLEPDAEKLQAGIELYAEKSAGEKEEPLAATA